MLRRLRLTLAVVVLVPLAACFVENISGRYCNVDADCTDSAYDKCDARHKTCVPHTLDLDMGTGGDGDLAMPSCATSATCPASLPVCGPTQVCGSCGATGMSTECNSFHTTPMPGTPFCGPSGGCVECLTKDNCDGVHQTCSPTNTCVPCVVNSDCTSGVCNAGVCADKMTLLYVNNANGSGCSDTGAGSFAMPFCTVQKGLNASAMTGKQVVVLAGIYAENVSAATTLNGGNDYVATAIGVGTPTIKPTSSGAALSVGGTVGKQVTVSFDGFIFDGSTLADGSNGVTCAGSMSNTYGKTLLTVTRSTIKGASGVGLLSQQQCTLTFDADTITGNKGGGLRFDASDFAFTNLLIYGNGTAGTATGSAVGGMLFSSAGEAGKMNMFNLTVVNNVSSSTLSTSSGIACMATPTALANTLILGNQGPAMEVGAGCAPSYSAYIGGTGSNNENIPLTGCAVSDLVVDPAQKDFHPKKGGARPCTLVDQGTSTGAPNHDLDGLARPQPGGNADIGCYEAK